MVVSGSLSCAAPVFWITIQRCLVVFFFLWGCGKELVSVLWAIFLYIDHISNCCCCGFICVCLFYRLLHREGLLFHNQDSKCHSKQDIDISTCFLQNASNLVAQWMKLSTKFVMFCRSLWFCFWIKSVGLSFNSVVVGFFYLIFFFFL